MRILALSSVSSPILSHSQRLWSPKLDLWLHSSGHLHIWYILRECQGAKRMLPQTPTPRPPSWFTHGKMRLGFETGCLSVKDDYILKKSPNINFNMPISICPVYCLGIKYKCHYFILLFTINFKLYFEGEYWNEILSISLPGLYRCTCCMCFKGKLYINLVTGWCLAILARSMIFKRGVRPQMIHCQLYIF